MIADTSPHRSPGEAPPVPLLSGLEPDVDAGADPDPDFAAIARPGADWRDSLPPELREDAALRDFGDVAALAKSYLYARRLVGGEKIAIPGRNAPPEAWAAVFDRPRSPADYAFAKPEDPHFAYDDALEEVFRHKAHELGLLPTQAAGLHGWWLATCNEIAAHQLDANGSRRAETMAALRGDWGGRYDENLRRANATLRRFGDAGLRGRLAEGLGDDPAFIRFCARVGEGLVEDRLAGTGDGSLSPGVDAKRRIADIFADRAHSYFERDDPRHAHAVEEVRQLFEAAYG